MVYGSKIDSLGQTPFATSHSGFNIQGFLWRSKFIPISQVVSDPRTFRIIGVISGIWPYQRFGKSFRVQLIYSQHLIDLPTPSTRKIDLRKKSFLIDFSAFTETAIMACKVLSKESHPQVKNMEKNFSRTRSQRVLIGF